MAVFGCVIHVLEKYDVHEDIGRAYGLSSGTRACNFLTARSLSAHFIYMCVDQRETSYLAFSRIQT